MQEIDFEGSESVVQTGSFKAFDYFGDGSFYLIDTPGHAVGHLAGLARTTTNPDTFIFMGGDLCHHSGEIRPSKYMGIPPEITVPTVARAMPCPGAIYQNLLTSRSRASDQSFFDPNMGLNIPQAIETINKTQPADASDNVWFIYAHDPSLWGVADLFPQSASDWKKKDWRNQTLWTFLKDFEAAIQKMT